MAVSARGGMLQAQGVSEVANRGVSAGCGHGGSHALGSESVVSFPRFSRTVQSFKRGW